MFLIDPDNWDYIISIETINNEKHDIPSIVKLVGIYILDKWVKNNLPDNISFATSPTGYSNNNITLP